ncbi:hypothetical protein ACFYVR_26090 [Rhodococcus sp. NPDC003318]|uniref:hypothetical protein n=1 Tax=Rhodococcus sp. NPDC003318 TaxID=3364503 RepID=UPI0036CEDD0E
METSTTTTSATQPVVAVSPSLRPLPVRVPVRAASRPSVWALVPGSLFADGRYRLLERGGGTADAAFWRAHDTVLARDVALTVIDLGDGDSAAALFDRTMWLCRTRSGAVAVVLDMFERDGRAVVVAQWKQSHALGLLRVGRPEAAAASVASLAGVLADGHREGAVAAIDHPSRVRVGSDGVAFLAFPGVPVSATARSDVRGLGNALSELLTGLHHVGDGRPLSPGALRPDVPEVLSELVVGAVGTGEGTADPVPGAVTADRFVTVLGAVAAEAAAVADGPGAEPAHAQSPSGGVHWRMWAPFVAGGALLVALATIGWFVGVALV